ncbi:MAG: XRE family transcriptional [Beijerinckiaceae bacterium]|nr:MAG: XRE family transcriptional [Beijerinckiaceae bacterium]
MVDYRKVLAENVKAARKALDISQESLALEAKIDRTYVSGIERGRRNPSLTMIAKLAEHLNTTPAALLTPANPAKS